MSFTLIEKGETCHFCFSVPLRLAFCEVPFSSCSWRNAGVLPLPAIVHFFCSFFNTHTDVCMNACTLIFLSCFFLFFSFLIFEQPAEDKGNRSQHSGHLITRVTKGGEKKKSAKMERRIFLAPPTPLPLPFSSPPSSFFLFLNLKIIQQVIRRKHLSPDE